MLLTIYDATQQGPGHAKVTVLHRTKRNDHIIADLAIDVRQDLIRVELDDGFCRDYRLDQLDAVLRAVAEDHIYFWRPAQEPITCS
jgi:hypothetical protein